MRKVIKYCFIIFFLFCFGTSAFCQTSNNTNTTPVSLEEDEIPQSLQDLRRFEIITLGSMPFVTLDAAIVYNGYKYAAGKTDRFNPLATADYNPAEMKTIIITSLCVSTGIGITDYVIRLIKRKSTLKKQKLKNTGISIEENPDAIKIPLPQNNDENSQQSEETE